MKSIRGGDIYDLDLGIADDFPPVGRRAGEAELRSRPLGGRLGHIGNSAQLNVERQAEDFQRRRETEHVRLAHKTCANKPRVAWA